MTDYLKLQGRRVVVFGVANKKSVAAFIAKTLLEVGADLVLVVRSEKRSDEVKKLFPETKILVCDVEHQDQIDRMGAELAADQIPIAGICHSIAFESKWFYPPYGSELVGCLKADLCKLAKRLFEMVWTVVRLRVIAGFG